MCPEKLVIPITEPQNEEEKQALEMFRGIIPESNKYDDFYLLKWLRARDLQIFKAKEMLEKNWEWRRENSSILDNILSTTPPQEILDNLQFKFTGTDSIGQPVLFEPIGKWEIRMLLEKGRQDDVFQLFYYILEHILKRIEDARKSNPMATQIKAVIDCEGLTWWKVGSMQVIQLVLRFARELEAYYPEILESIYIVNGHWALQYLFTLVKPILSTKTLGKFNIFTSNRKVWEKVLLENIPAAAIPVEYGGTADPF